MTKTSETSTIKIVPTPAGTGTASLLVRERNAEGPPFTSIPGGSAVRAEDRELAGVCVCGGTVRESDPSNLQTCKWRTVGGDTCQQVKEGWLLQHKRLQPHKRRTEMSDFTLMGLVHRELICCASLRFLKICDRSICYKYFRIKTLYCFISLKLKFKI